MTQQEAIHLYGKVGLKFASYYKFCFLFRGVADDGAKIEASFGGTHGDIYRLSVEADKAIPLSSYDWYSVKIRKDGQTVLCCEWQGER